VTRELSGYESIHELGSLLRRREVTVADIANGLAVRIQARNDLNCYVHVDFQGFERQAKALDDLLVKGRDLGPLHGIPVAIKDNIHTAGLPITGGSRALSGERSRSDAPAVAALRNAGAMIVGKTNLHELGAGDPVFGEVRNPWDPSRSAGASSGGSGSAVAAGLATLALGTDSGGSVRLPAAACGVVGMKPTHDLLARAGVVGGAFSLDAIGVITRDSHGSAVALEVMAQRRRGEPGLAATHILEDGVAGTRVGVPRKQEEEHLTEEVAGAVDRVSAILEGSGAELVSVELPDLAIARTIWFVIVMAENAEALSTMFRENAGDLSPGARWMIGSGRLMSATAYLHSQRLRAAINATIASLFDRIDLLVLPTMPVPAWPIGAESTEYDGITESELMAISRYAPLFNLTGQPVASIPAGFTTDGLPLAVQIAGRPYDEASVLRAAWTCEQELQWTDHYPEATPPES
jgi:aspartyl-tRNA(Asn)/glutamyl-tRNA(Gln) amidotransferase subunit A